MRDEPLVLGVETSWLKTAVARWGEARERAGEPVPVADVSASFQEAVCEVLTSKGIDACRSNGVKTLTAGVAPSRSIFRRIRPWV